MKPKILLINFTQIEANAVEKDTGLKILRGYLSESKGTIGAGQDRRQMLDFYSPEAFYECDMVFIKMPAGPKLEEEFKELATELTEDDRDKFRNYWSSRKRLMVVYVGDTNIGNLWPFGIPVLLSASSGNDTTTNTWTKDTHDLLDIVTQINGALKMPTARYMESGFKEDPGGRDYYYAYGTRWTNYSSNVNRDALAVALSKSNHDYSQTDPGVIVMGLPKKISTMTTRIIRFFGEYFEMFVIGSDWKKSDEFYPAKTIGKLKGEAEAILDQAKKQYEAKTKEIEETKEQYSFLVDLVTQQGAPLVGAVKSVLGDILGLNVIDADEENEGEPIEDLFVTLSAERQISVEVKGTAKPNAPLEYTQQPFQHITRRGYGATVEAALILNHDMNKYPPQRAGAYTDADKEPLLAGLHFIDTRVLLKVANDVIDGKITKEIGAEVLFNKMGRITYSSPEERDS